MGARDRTFEPRHFFAVGRRSGAASHSRCDTGSDEDQRPHEDRDGGLRPSTVARAEFHLRRFFELDDKDVDRTIPYARPGGLLDDLRARRCSELYAKPRGEVEVDTHRNALAAAKAFGAWCVEQTWLRDNPVEDVKPVGERNRGKPQLRIDEARKLVELCFRLADNGHVGAITILTALTLGLRASEITDRVCP